MTGMKVDEWLSALRKERSWEEIGGRKLPFVTIALKYVDVSVFLFIDHDPVHLPLFPPSLQKSLLI